MPGKVDFEKMAKRVEKLNKKVDDVLVTLNAEQLRDVGLGLGIRKGRIENQSILVMLREISNFIEKKCLESPKAAIELLTPLYRDIRGRLLAVSDDDSEESDAGDSTEEDLENYASAKENQPEVNSDDSEESDARDSAKEDLENYASDKEDELEVVNVDGAENGADVVENNDADKNDNINDGHISEEEQEEKEEVKLERKGVKKESVKDQEKERPSNDSKRLHNENKHLKEQLRKLEGVLRDKELEAAINESKRTAEEEKNKRLKEEQLKAKKEVTKRDQLWKRAKAADKKTPVPKKDEKVGKIQETGEKQGKEEIVKPRKVTFGKKEEKQKTGVRERKIVPSDPSGYSSSEDDEKAKNLSSSRSNSSGEDDKKVKKKILKDRKLVSSDTPSSSDLSDEDVRPAKRVHKKPGKKVKLKKSIEKIVESSSLLSSDENKARKSSKKQTKKKHQPKVLLSSDEERRRRKVAKRKAKKALRKKSTTSNTDESNKSEDENKIKNTDIRSLKAAWRPKLKFDGQIGATGQKEKLDLVSLKRQIKSAQRKDPPYEEHEIIEAVIRCITAGTQLRRFFETSPDLKLDEIVEHLEAHFLELEGKDLVTQLSKLRQNKGENAHDFLLRGFELKHRILKENSVSEEFVQDMLLGTLETGFASESIRNRMRRHLEDPMITEAKLSKAVSRAMKSCKDTESKFEEDSNKRTSARVNQIEVDGDAVAQLVAEVKCIKIDVADVKEMKADIAELKDRSFNKDNTKGSKVEYGCENCKASGLKKRCTHCYTCGKDNHRFFECPDKDKRNKR